MSLSFPSSIQGRVQGPESFCNKLGGCTSSLHFKQRERRRWEETGSPSQKSWSITITSATLRTSETAPSSLSHLENGLTQPPAQRCSTAGR